jgi:hypothetical protein
MPKYLLSDRFVANVTPRGTPDFPADAAGRIEIGDLRVAGLELRITPRGLKTWTFTYKLRGKQRRVTLGHYPGMSVKEARSAALAHREDLQMGVDPSEPRTDTFEAVALLYVEKSLNGRVKTPRLWSGVIWKHVIPRWGDRPIGEITRGDCHLLIDEVKVTGIGAARESRKNLHSMFEWCVDRELLKVNPLHRLRRLDLAPNPNARRPSSYSKKFFSEAGLFRTPLCIITDYLPAPQPRSRLSHSGTCMMALRGSKGTLSGLMRGFDAAIVSGRAFSMFLNGKSRP